MTRVLVSTLPEEGHLNPTFKVSRTLAARGVEVTYLAVPDLERHVVAQGFATLPFLPDLFPAGSTLREASASRLAQRREITRRFEAVTARLLEPGGLRASIERLAPDLMLVDVNQPTLQFLAAQLGITTVAVNTSLPQTRDPGVPPLRTGATWRPGAAGRLLAALRWERFLARRRLVASAAGLIGARPPYELARRAAARFGVPRRRLDCDTAYMPRLVDTPELVLCPEEFDFPRPPAAGRHFVESIDLERREVAFPWERLDGSRPLVYVSMGSRRYQPLQVPRMLASAVRALGTRPDWQAVVAVGQHLEPAQLAPRPPNVVVVRSAPQLALLGRAAAAVIHGGLGGVKECILHGVPMVVFPLAIDQPDNAARVVYHRLGLRGGVRATSGEELLSMLDRVIGGDDYRARTTAMGAAFRATEGAARGADVVCRLLSLPVPGSAPAGTLPPHRSL